MDKALKLRLTLIKTSAKTPRSDKAVVLHGYRMAKEAGPMDWLRRQEWLKKIVQALQSGQFKGIPTSLLAGGGAALLGGGLGAALSPRDRLLGSLGGALLGGGLGYLGGHYGGKRIGDWAAGKLKADPSEETAPRPETTPMPAQVPPEQKPFNLVDKQPA